MFSLGVLCIELTCELRTKTANNKKHNGKPKHIAQVGFDVSAAWHLRPGHGGTRGLLFLMGAGFTGVD